MKITWIVLFIVSFLLGENCLASNKNLVTISFDLNHPEYSREFSKDERKLIAQKVAIMLSDQLNQKAPFLNFQIEGDSEYQLKLIMAPKDRHSSGGLQEIGLHFQLLHHNDAGDATLSEHYWPFRTVDQADKPVGNVPVFLRDIQTVLENNDYITLMQSVLSTAPVSNASKFLPELPGWELKHSYQDLCLKENTILNIDTRMKKESIILSAKFRSKVEIKPDPDSPDFSANYSFNIICRALEGQQDYSQLQQSIAENVRERGVFIIQFSRLESCNPSISPEEAGL